MTTVLWSVLFFFAGANALTLDQVRAEGNPEHRAKAAVEYAALAERAAESANDNGDQARLTADIKSMVEAMELARDSFVAAGKTPNRQPGSFKGAEMQSHELLHRLSDLQNKMDLDQKAVLDGPIMKIQEIHDAWFDGIMGKKK
jgi:hypothetical protein